LAYDTANATNNTNDTNNTNAVIVGSRFGWPPAAVAGTMLHPTTAPFVMRPWTDDVVNAIIVGDHFCPNRLLPCPIDSDSGINRLISPSITGIGTGSLPNAQLNY
jgi:hypothetical protein